MSMSIMGDLRTTGPALAAARLAATVRVLSVAVFMSGPQS